MPIEIFECEQGTPEWVAARCGIITASKFSDVLAGGQGKTRRKYMLELAGERIRGEVAEGYKNAHMDRGTEHEKLARLRYAERTNQEVRQVGFIRDGSYGCSPDGLIGEDGMVEFKSNLPHILAEMLLANKVPTEHVGQLQGGLKVANRVWIDFVSFFPGMPMFISRVHRNEDYIKNLNSELLRFDLELKEVVNKLGRMF